MAATIATTAATIKKIGFISICTPNFTKAVPRVPSIDTKLPIPFKIDAGLTVDKVVAKVLALVAASSKSRLMILFLIPSNPLLTCSNLEPDAKTLTASLASFILSFSSPAAIDNLAISAGSVALAISPFKSLSSALMAPRPETFIGISTSFIIRSI